MTNLTRIFHPESLDALKEFAQRRDLLGILERDVPKGAEVFFETLMQTPFALAGKVHKEKAVEDIRDILEDKIPAESQSEPFYPDWLADMGQVCTVFCETQNTPAVSFWLGSQRGCRRYHVDRVPLRMLVTYAGKGTEWLPNEAANRQAFARGEPNEAIVKDHSALQFINPWDVAVFRGGDEGVLHRTPDAALNGSSILMRLDHPSFWDEVLKYQQYQQ